MKEEYVKIKIGFGESTTYVIAKKGERVKLPNGTFVTAGLNKDDKPVLKSELKELKKKKKLALKKK